MTITLELEDDAVDKYTEIARATIWGASLVRQDQLAGHRRNRAYRDGKAGVPDVPDGSEDEITELAKLSVRNVCGVVVDTFLRGLSCVGFRSPEATDDEPAWAWWQRHNMDARQSEVHEAALTYGWSFVSVLPDDDDEPTPRTWTPGNVVADYDDPRADLFPRSAVLMRAVERPLLGKGTAVLFVDETSVQPAFIPKRRKRQKLTAESVIFDGEAWDHGAKYEGKPVCPVVRFVNERTAEDRDPLGEVEPLINAQRAINSVNFDRLVVSRGSAFEQKVVIGWAASAEQVAKASAMRVWAFEDHPSDVKVESLPASPLGPYDLMLREMTEAVALEAGIPLHAATGNLSNVSTDTAALAESAHQRKLQLKRESFGESWEQVIRLAVAMKGGTEPDEAAEMIWRETEARSFAQVVDGIVKLAQVPDGVPVEEVLDLIPGLSQQRITAILKAIKARRAPASGDEPAPSSTEDAAALKAKFDALGVAVRAGVDPDDAASRLGLSGVKFTGATPVALRLPKDDAAALEER